MEKRAIRRVFDMELKLEIVKQIEKGKLTQTEVSRMYGVSTTAVRKWLYKYSDIYRNQTRVVVEKKSISKKNQELRNQIKELERALGQKQMRVDYLEKLLEVASERLGEDIEKKTKRLL
jgi:transposase-like protein